jgi:cytochrome c-type biogenesis protein CcmE
MKLSRKLLVAALVLVSAVSYLAYAGARKGWVYYVQVDQFMADSQYKSQRVRLCGKVAADQLAIAPGRLGATFVILGEKERVPVNFRGAVPDLFKADCDVVAEGKLDDAGVFQADVIMTKCASKYENGKMVPAPEKGQ